MKIRKGFVSNSSSSSFLLGVALIEDEDKFNKWWESLNKKWWDHDVRISTVHDLKNNFSHSGWGTIRVEDECLKVECFRGDVVQLSLENRAPSDRVLIVDIANNEGDCGFPTEDGELYGSPDYDIDLEFLGEQQIALYHGITSKENGLVDGQVKFGAARNG